VETQYGSRAFGCPSSKGKLRVRNRIREIRRNDKGFTLIELLITVIILGVLAGIVVFAVGAFNDDGVKAACKADVKNVEIASEAYFARSAAPRAYAPTVAALVTAKYLREVPSSTSYTIGYDPATGAVTGTLTPGTTSCLV
jgi:prepilin-type N-terminal cleavage/methylation domain-containing protein